jgi:hypothetical protein
MNTVLTVLWRNCTLVTLCEENHENLGALEGGCVHWYSKNAYIGSSRWGTSGRAISAKGNCTIGKLRSSAEVRWYYGWCLLLKELKCDLRAGHSPSSLPAHEIMTATAENHVKPHICETHFNITFPPRPYFLVIFPLGGGVQPFSLYSHPHHVTWRARFCT